MEIQGSGKWLCEKKVTPISKRGLMTFLGNCDELGANVERSNIRLACGISTFVKDDLLDFVLVVKKNVFGVVWDLYFCVR
jgi:hypothetical protein